MYKRKKSPKTSKRPPRRKGLLKSLLTALSKRFKILAVSLVLVLGTFLVLGAVYAFQYFRDSVTQASAGAALGSSNLDTTHDFNLLLFELESLSDPTSAILGAAVVNFKPEEKSWAILKIDPADTVDNIYGSGQIKIASLFGLSSLGGSRPGSFSLERALSLQLGLPIDGAFYTDAAGLARMSQALGFKASSESLGALSLSGVRTVRAAIFLGTTLKTNLDLKSLASLFKYLAFNFPENKSVLNLSGISENQAKYDLLFREKLADEEVVRERQTVIILNGTSTPGLARAVGRLASNLGLSLLGNFNAPSGELYRDSILITKNPHSFSTSKMSSIFNVSDVRTTDSLSDDPKFNRLLRADLVFIAGNDLLQAH